MTAASSTLIFEFQSGGEATLVVLLLDWFCEIDFVLKFQSVNWYWKYIYIYVFIWNDLKWNWCLVLEFSDWFTKRNKISFALGSIDLPINQLIDCWFQPLNWNSILWLLEYSNASKIEFYASKQFWKL